MSEDESMGDSLMEEDEEDEDSSSESVDEELKLTKNFVDALSRIELNKNNYDEYILLVSTLLLLCWLVFHGVFDLVGGYRSRSHRFGQNPAER
jgi:hypothetical protein